MRRLIDNDLLTMISRLVVGIVFIYASFYKVIDPGSFARSIWFYHLVPGNLINLIALILPWLELLCGLALVFGIHYRGAVIWANVLTIVFIIALYTTIYRGLSVDCGCFKASGAASYKAWRSIIFDLFLLVFTLHLYFSRSQRWRLAR
ncbi:MAG: DoxX family membrane protein [candidate division Zixibacteria bacterium]|nr:DoxX family membrane protein [candidate division Zixibacteria bacterium]MDD5425373.1 DoxX family membrane protein [candidate division Zixibacteria bacterium]